MATFGDTSTTATVNEYWAEDEGFCRKFALSEAGSVSSIHVLAKIRGGFSYGKFKAMLFEDNAGSPGDLLGVTGEFTLEPADTTFAFRQCNFASAISCPAGNYWLAAYFGLEAIATVEASGADSGGDSYWGIGGDYSAGTVTDPCGIDIEYGHTLRIYATYTPTATAVHRLMTCGAGQA